MISAADFEDILGASSSSKSAPASKPKHDMSHKSLSRWEDDGGKIASTRRPSERQKDSNQ